MRIISQTRGALLPVGQTADCLYTYLQQVTGQTMGLVSTLGDQVAVAERIHDLIRLLRRDQLRPFRRGHRLIVSTVHGTLKMILQK